MDGALAPDADEEILIYQTLARRMAQSSREAQSEGVSLKALREAKQHSSWIAPQRAVRTRRAGFRGPHPGREDHFLPDFRELKAYLAAHGARNGLASC